MTNHDLHIGELASFNRRGQAKTLVQEGHYDRAATRQYEAYLLQLEECPPRPDFEGKYLPNIEAVENYLKYWVTWAEPNPRPTGKDKRKPVRPPAPDNQ